MSDFDNSDETFFQVQVQERDHWEVFLNFRTLTEAKGYLSRQNRQFSRQFKWRIVQAIIVHRANYD